MEDAIDLSEAKRTQLELAKKVSLTDCLPDSIGTIAGMDISHKPFDPSQIIHGAVVVLSYPALTPIEVSSTSFKQTFPYIPGFLGFREAPPLLDAYQKLSIRPDLLFVDGHGICHPRGLGIASHVGVLLDIPTIGVAKSILIGKPMHPLGTEAGSTAPLIWQGKQVGILLRSKKGCLPLIISPGHKISFETAVQWVIACIKKHRLPEPTRHAHEAANRTRKSALAN